jgi:hypothetical protein
MRRRLLLRGAQPPKVVAVIITPHQNLAFFATISVSDAFLDKGEIVSTPGRNAEETPNASTPGRAT